MNEFVVSWDSPGHRAKPLKVRVSDCGCHEVVSHRREKKGYFLIYRGKRRVKAHRYSYEQNKGKIPEGMLIRHTCDNDLCINPEHLILGTGKDNWNDWQERGINAKKFKPFGSGEENPTSKLKLKDVIFIKCNLDIPNKMLAEKFGVEAEQIRRIKKGERWGHVDVSQH